MVKDRDPEEDLSDEESDDEAEQFILDVLRDRDNNNE